jgi:hypothetical protein
MSTLSVGDLQGLAVNSNVVTVPTGHKLEVTDAGALTAPGHILQVVSTTKTDTFTTTSTSFTDITGLSVSITPTSASSQVFVTLTIGMVDNSATGQSMAFDVTRAGTPVGIGDTAGSRIRAAIGYFNAGSNRPTSVAWSYLDSPATTSATTYQARCLTVNTLYLNRSYVDTDSAVYPRAVSTLTVIEVSA